MGDQNEYKENREQSAQKNIRNFNSYPKRKPPTQADEERISETKAILVECYPELIPHIEDLIALGMLEGFRDVRASRLSPNPLPKIEALTPIQQPNSAIVNAATINKIITHVVRNTFHPVNGNDGFDVLTITAHSIEQLDKAIAAAEAKSWLPCPRCYDLENNQHLTISMFKSAVINYG